jgi:hypothetical protein
VQLILWPFGIFYGYLVCCSQKNLATLIFALSLFLSHVRIAFADAFTELGKAILSTEKIGAKKEIRFCGEELLSKVTGLGEVSPLGQLFSTGRFF